ncbi:acyloxyacyl hydrolase [Oceanimonas baumannii]|uniref:acyloxyacyl hydrolase n=1 Tax=Oceanimonas baumannii TaxID=129578 RepID=UPI003A8EC806
MDQGKFWLWAVLLVLPFPVLGGGTPAGGISAGWGDGAERYGLGIQWQKEWRTIRSGKLDITLNLDGSYWTSDDDELTQISLVPGLVYMWDSPGLSPLLYAGVGPAWINQTRLGERELSTQLQFNSRAGLGVMLGRHSLALEAWHLSNAGLKQPNDGLTSWGISYRYRLD